MHLTFGTGLFWIIIASIVGETFVHIAKVRSAKGPDNTQLRALTDRVADLEKRLETQMELTHSQDDTIRRLEESTDFMERLLHDREPRSLPQRGESQRDR